jgi:hypothetical protein
MPAACAFMMAWARSTTCSLLKMFETWCARSCASARAALRWWGCGRRGRSARATGHTTIRSELHRAAGDRCAQRRRWWIGNIRNGLDHDRDPLAPRPAEVVQDQVIAVEAEGVECLAPRTSSMRSFATSSASRSAPRASATVGSPGAGSPGARERGLVTAPFPAIRGRASIDAEISAGAIQAADRLRGSRTMRGGATSPSILSALVLPAVRCSRPKMTR